MTTQLDPQEVTVFGVGDYFTKNAHLYFITDHCMGGFVVENCETLFSHPVEYDFVRDATEWVATDKNYRRGRNSRKGVKQIDD